MTATTLSPSQPLPRPTSALALPFAGQSPTSLIAGLLVAGALSTIAFDAFGQGLSPLAGFAQLAPVPLANAVVNTVFGGAIKGAGTLLHLAAGLLAYPLGWLVVETGRRTLAPKVPMMVVAAVYGVLLWVFALYGMAHLVAGNPPFLGFTEVAWVALVGHILFAVVLAAMVTWQERRAR